MSLPFPLLHPVSGCRKGPPTQKLWVIHSAALLRKEMVSISGPTYSTSQKQKARGTEVLRLGSGTESLSALMLWGQEPA